MRTTIRLDKDLLKELKQLSAESGQTMTSIIEDALRSSLQTRKQPEKKQAVKLLVVNGDGLQAGVDLDDSAALLDLMES